MNYRLETETFKIILCDELNVSKHLLRLTLENNVFEFDVKIYKTIGNMKTN